MKNALIIIAAILCFTSAAAASGIASPIGFTALGVMMLALPRVV
jgi:hypothetical protein